VYHTLSKKVGHQFDARFSFKDFEDMKFSETIYLDRLVVQYLVRHGSCPESKDQHFQQLLEFQALTH